MQLDVDIEYWWLSSHGWPLGKWIANFQNKIPEDSVYIKLCKKKYFVIKIELNLSSDHYKQFCPAEYNCATWENSVWGTFPHAVRLWSLALPTQRQWRVPVRNAPLAAACWGGTVGVVLWLWDTVDTRSCLFSGLLACPAGTRAAESAVWGLCRNRGLVLPRGCRCPLPSPFRSTFPARACQHVVSSGFRQ